MFRLIRSIIISLVFASSALSAYAVLINFDTYSDNSTPINAPLVYNEASPCPVIGPLMQTYEDIGVTINGGITLRGDYFGNNSNLFATSDFALLADDSPLPGVITITFSEPVSYVSVKIKNGFDKAKFSMTDNNRNKRSITLNPYKARGDSGYIILRGKITQVTITSSQAVGNINFAIDDLTYTPLKNNIKSHSPMRK